MDFFDEVKYEAQFDKISFFLHKYAKIIILLVCSALICFAGYFFWQRHHDDIIIAAANNYEKALTVKGNNKVQELQNIVASNKTIFNILAQLKLAEIYLQDQD